MSRSVVQQMRHAEYSYDQMETLLEQRRKVLEVIKRTEYLVSRPYPGYDHDFPIASVGVAAPAAQQFNVDQLPMSPAETPDNTSAQSVATSPVKTKKAKKLICNFQVCHACRPFLRDRVPMSFEPALNSELPAVTESEIAELSIIDPAIVRNIGLGQPRKVLEHLQTQDITEANMHQADGNEDESTDWTPTTATSSACYSDDDDDPYPCPGAGQCPVANDTGVCAYDIGFDDGKRAYNHGFGPLLPQASSSLPRVRANLSIGTSSNGSSISLPDPKTEPLTPPTPSSMPFELQLSSKRRGTGNSPTLAGLGIDAKDSDRSASRSASSDSNNSSVGSEVEVEGGVALTEEAVESGTPDIATDREGIDD